MPEVIISILGLEGGDGMKVSIEERAWSKLCDGKRDATTFIQLMINRTQDAIIIPNGTYLCSKPLQTVAKQK